MKQIEVDGIVYRMLPADDEALNRLDREGIPHLWHGIPRDGGKTGVFATFLQKPTKELPVKRYVTHRVMD